MEAKELNRLLIDRFPELEKKYHDEVDWQEGNETGSHVVYGDVLAPYLEAAVAQNKQEVLKKMFVFVEDILCQNEDYSDEVIMFSVLERILYDKEQVQNCRKYFGKRTEKGIRETQQQVLGTIAYF